MEDIPEAIETFYRVMGDLRKGDEDLAVAFEHAGHVVNEATTVHTLFQELGTLIGHALTLIHEAAEIHYNHLGVCEDAHNTLERAGLDSEAIRKIIEPLLRDEVVQATLPPEAGSLIDLSTQRIAPLYEDIDSLPNLGREVKYQLFESQQSISRAKIAGWNYRDSEL